jgi:phosphate acetyltransferase
MLSQYLQGLLQKASKNKKTIVLPEGTDERVLTAAHLTREADAAHLIILGHEDEIFSFFKQKGWSTDGIRVIDPETSDHLPEYTELLYSLRKEKGMTHEQAEATAKDYTYFGTLMIKAGHADGLVSGANHSTADTVRPALQIIKSAHKDRCVSSFMIMVSNGRPYLMSDCGLNINPTEKELADIAVTSAETALQFDIEPKIAMLSYSTRGSGKGESAERVRQATALAREVLASAEYNGAGIEIDGEMQADAALNAVVSRKKAPDSRIDGQARVLIMPNLDAGNICYKLLQRLGGCEAYGPVLQGLNAPINDLSRGAFAEDIVGTIAITCLQATHS